MPAQTGPECRCGHARHWHYGYHGRCEITGPQPSDGCNCTHYNPKGRPE